MDATWTALLSALAGAVVGGFASAYGAHLSTRRDHLRALRVELHRELLPALWGRNGGFAHPPGPGWPTGHWGDVVRAAEAGAKRERDFARSLRQRLLTHAEIRAQLDWIVDDRTLVAELTGPRGEEHDAALADVREVVAEYEEWLRKRLA